MPTVPPFHVLGVEDEPDVAHLIKHTLERNGDLRVDIAAAGDTALQAVAGQAPDLVILDLNLPGWSGLDVCRIIRARLRGKLGAAGRQIETVIGLGYRFVE